ncbi:MAG TPA: hypothetical protein VNN17_00890, partial [Terriglobia bacterium]|nr:hypothetical protein [Terriglobia bacterium]
MSDSELHPHFPSAAGPVAAPVYSPASQAPELESCLRAAVDSLRKAQYPEGYWLGELEADSSLEADA